ncbi:MAG: undecaprenyldiphospho-muramoylpentapeptide beta-N-acetylglucosaminyltransferase [Firmicutes bacterium]|nr:undecaprenyldiphospho-muramoylpentapeptide beta-N-acetylglucosaminyltransferase [Bacillota bacterium]
MKIKSPNFVVTGGKTGGHIYPALAIAEILENEYSIKPYYIGAKNGMESKILENEKITFFGLNFAPLVGISGLKKIKSILINIGGFFSSLSLLFKLKPKLIIGTGGFVSGPVLAAAFVLRIPIIIHEQNVAPGFTNKILSRISKEIWITFNESSKYFPNNKRKVLTGMPLRKNFQKLIKKDSKNYFGISEGEKVLLIAGGSQGSKLINDAVKKLYTKITQDLDMVIIHITGSRFYEEIINSLNEEESKLVKSGKLIIKDYISEMEQALNASEIIISRAGASFICELVATKSYSILIPIKKSASNHQLMNAKAIEKSGMGTIIEEDYLTSELLYSTLSSLKPFRFDNIISNNAGILYGENTKDIIRKESGKYLNE